MAFIREKISAIHIIDGSIILQSTDCIPRGIAASHSNHGACIVTGYCSVVFAIGKRHTLYAHCVASKRSNIRVTGEVRREVCVVCAIDILKIAGAIVIRIHNKCACPISRRLNTARCYNVFKYTGSITNVRHTNSFLTVWYIVIHFKILDCCIINIWEQLFVSVKSTNIADRVIISIKYKTHPKSGILAAAVVNVTIVIIYIVSKFKV